MEFVILALLAMPALPGAQDARAASELVRVTLGAGTVMPRVDRQVMPTYPPEAGDARGVVQVEVVVGTNGMVLHARVGASPDASGSLDRTALEAVQSWRFRPASDGSGRPIPVLVLLNVEFVPPTPAGGQSRVSVQMSKVLARPLPPRDSPIAAYAPPTRGLQHPKVVRQVKPSYTSEAMRAKIQGTVTLEVTVQADGTVGETRVVKSLDRDLGLDQAALIAARYWFFEPATLDGRPVALKVILEMSFALH